MLNREIMKKTITDLKNNKEFLKKKEKLKNTKNGLRLEEKKFSDFQQFLLLLQ